MRQAVTRCGIMGMGFILFASVGAQALDVEETRATLRGLQGVQVIVETIGPDTEPAGLTTNQIQTDVELRLRKAGIRILTKQESQSSPGRPWLYVRVATYKTTAPGLYAVVLGLELHQSVYLARDPNITTQSSTWSHAGMIGTTGTSRLQKLREDIADICDAFINAYLAVNPEQAGRTLPSSRVNPPAKR